MRILLFLTLFLGLSAFETGEVPSDLKDCMSALDKYFTDDEKKQFLSYTEKSIIEAYNFSAGAYIRNHWGLNDEGSDLYKFFSDRGIENPTQMSNIILVSYYRVRQNNFIQLEDQIKAYIGEKQVKKVKKKLDRKGKEL